MASVREYNLRVVSGDLGIVCECESGWVCEIALCMSVGVWQAPWGSGKRGARVGIAVDNGGEHKDVWAIEGLSRLINHRK